MNRENYREFDFDNHSYHNCSRCFNLMHLMKGCEWPTDQKYVFCNNCKLEILIELSKKVIQIKEWCEKLGIGYERYKTTLNERIEELEEAIKEVETNE